MRTTDDQKKNLQFYILEKINQRKTQLTKSVAGEYGVNQATVHRHINEMVKAGWITRTKRGEYELVDRIYEYHLIRSAGDLDSDIWAYDLCLMNYIKDFPKNIRDIWSYAFSEMVNNVMDHSMAENLRITIKQNYLDTQAILVDDGIGIFKKIKDHFNLPSLDAAIQELFKGKLTTDKQNHSGEGIFFTSKLMDLFFIVSDGKVFTCNRYDSVSAFDLPEVQKGTGILMTLSNFSMKHSKDIFDLFSDPESGFTKTRIPLRNMFDSSPVSRSQAKRVCNRLSDFQEVEFDFSEISWMGQGFAHQIFVVFQNEHPDMKLLPINMNEAVENMYRHVRP